MMITLDDVKAFFAEKKDEDDVKAFIQSFIPEHKITPEEVSEFISTAEGEKVIQPIVDARVTSAVQKRDKYWKEEGLEPEVKKRVASEVLKLNPKEDPVSKQLKEMQERIDASERNAQIDKLKRQVVEKATEIGVDPFYIENYFPSSLEENELYMQKIKDHDKKVAEKAINDLIASKSFVPNGGKVKSSSRIDISKLSQKEVDDLEANGELDNLLNDK